MLNPILRDLFKDVRAGGREGVKSTGRFLVEWFCVSSVSAPTSRPSPRLWKDLGHLGLFLSNIQLLCGSLTY